jgi:hypothetical protein
MLQAQEVFDIFIKSKKIINLLEHIHYQEDWIIWVESLLFFQPNSLGPDNSLRHTYASSI